MRRQGLTIIEVLVALAVIGIIFVVLANSQVLSLRVTSDSQKASIATQVANTAIERASRDVLASSAAFERYLACSVESEGCSASYVGLVRGYGADYAFEGMLDGTEAGLVRIDVQVSNPAPLNVSHYVSCMDVTPNPTILAPAPCPWSPVTP